MKIKLVVMLTLFSFLIGGVATAQKGTPKKRTVFLKTNAQCGDCKERIEKVMNFEKGIIYAELHLDSKELEVRYNSKRVTLEKIKEIVSKIGYSADDVEADAEAQGKLPLCCQPGGH